MSTKFERKGPPQKRVKIQKEALPQVHAKKQFSKPHASVQQSKKPAKTSKLRQETRIPAEQKGKQRAVAPATQKITETRQPLLEDPAPLPSTFKVVAGSYEKLLYGFEVVPSARDEGYAFEFKIVFIFPAHITSIKAVAASPHGGKWLATGSADEIVKVWDLKRRKEIGGLMHHEGNPPLF